jgi:hypothetical protein
LYLNKQCELFLGSSEREGEMHFIAKSIKGIIPQCVRVMDQYRIIIKNLMDSNNFIKAISEIKNLLVYLALKLRIPDPEIARMVLERSYIKSVFVFNEFPIIQGIEYQKTIFECYKDQLEYDSLDKTLVFNYDHFFLIRVALDIA